MWNGVTFAHVSACEVAKGDLRGGGSALDGGHGWLFVLLLLLLLCDGEEFLLDVVCQGL